MQEIPLSGIPRQPPAGFGTYLQNNRRRIGASLRQVTDSCPHVSHTSLANMESGRIQDPSLYALMELAEAYKVSPVEMIRQAGFELQELRPNAVLKTTVLYNEGLETMDSKAFDVVLHLVRYLLGRA